MIDPYKMVLINVIISSFFIIVYFFYKYVFPRKSIPLSFILIILSLLVCISIFRTGVYESGDFLIHLYRTIEFNRSLQDGQWYPSWAAGLNATYGYPLFIFNYTLPYYLISFFHFIGFSFITSMKIFLALSYVISGIGMYLAAKQIFHNEKAAFVTAIFYQFAPYHLIDLHFKIVIGELMIFSLLPFLFYSIHKLWQTKSVKWLSLTSIFVALLVMSHVVLALFCLLVIFCYMLFLFLQKRRKHILYLPIVAIILGALSSMYMWLAPLLMTKYTLFKTAEDFVYFPQLWELLYAPWRFGMLYQGHYGELSFLLGYTHLIVIIAFGLLFTKKKVQKKHKSYIIFWLIFLFLTIFLITPFSKPVWSIIPFLKVTGSHRLLIIAVFIIAILAGYLTLHLKNQKLLFILVFITVFSTILNWGHRNLITNVSDKDIINHVWKSTSEIEGHFYANSKWRSMNNPWFNKLPKAPLEVTEGSAEIKVLHRSSVTHTYAIYAKQDSTLKDNTLYFPGWRGLINNRSLSIYPDKDGIISTNITKGLHYVEISYDDIPEYKTIKTISMTGLCFLFLTVVVIYLRGFLAIISKLVPSFSSLSTYFRNLFVK